MRLSVPKGEVWRETAEPVIALAAASIVLLFLFWPGVVGFPDFPVAARSTPGDATRQRELPQRHELRPQQPAPAPIAPAAGLVPLNSAALTEKLNASVVLIVGATPDGKTDSGTGFLVAPGRVVTNRHVIDAFAPDRIRVASKTITQPVAAHVLAQTPPGNTLDSPDLALLQIDAPGSGFLTLGPSPEKSAAIVAAGYPETHRDPDPVQTPGTVLEKSDALSVKFLALSTTLGHGSAGSAVVDLCGRVVGINTAAKDAPGEGGETKVVNLAQDVSEVAKFLAANGVKATAADTPCAVPGGTTAAAPAPP